MEVKSADHALAFANAKEGEIYFGKEYGLVRITKVEIKYHSLHITHEQIEITRKEWFKLFNKLK